MDRRLGQLPSVHELVSAARALVAERRKAILDGRPADPEVTPDEVVARAMQRPLRRVVNATGVVLHTNLGRAPLAPQAIAAIEQGYSNLEYDLSTGARGSRHDHLRAILCEKTGAEDAIVVNNNAAATVLGLAALATDREVIVSRGELIEIGGSFRLPEILTLSRGILVEVGTTNKTHAKDYERAITERTGLLLKVHRSNFAVIGFTAEVSIEELVALGRARNLPTMVDLGSGALVDRETQRRWGLPDEPTVREVLAAGTDLVTISGDKLLGGPQAGIALGTRAAIAACRSHPLMRALRPDKLAIAALGATLALDHPDIPVLAMLSRSPASLEASARALAARLADVGVAVSVEECTSAVGGGAMPTAELPSWAVTVDPSTETTLRSAPTPVIARISDGKLWLDVRTITDAEHDFIVEALRGR